LAHRYLTIGKNRPIKINSSTTSITTANATCEPVILILIAASGFRACVQTLAGPVAGTSANAHAREVTNVLWCLLVSEAHAHALVYHTLQGKQKKANRQTPLPCLPVIPLITM
jgi:hypothetical protein